MMYLVAMKELTVRRIAVVGLYIKAIGISHYFPSFLFLQFRCLLLGSPLNHVDSLFLSSMFHRIDQPRHNNGVLRIPHLKRDAEEESGTATEAILEVVWIVSDETTESSPLLVPVNADLYILLLTIPALIP
ncbi:hypothetical protein PanWU01x14_270330 [Parasponia andersonii]|uniref:Uncharacterized protein n=1 Tax=Parasponia andersonii TaxID=3476 RepID=A0A2P5B551_PARAD|nr:hypothetical protein PanWU01x14_270330 [Parasponia andersonii]